MQSVQMAQVSVSRIQKCHAELKRIQAICEQQKKDLEEAKAKVSEYEDTHRSLFAEHDKLKSAFDHTKRREAELERTIARLEGQKAELEHNLQAEVKLAFQDGADAAGEEYAAQVNDIRISAWEMGWRAALDKMGVSHEHPAYARPDEYPCSGFAEDAETCPAVQPGPETPLAEPEAPAAAENPTAASTAEAPPAA